MLKIRQMAFGRAFQLSYFFSYNKLAMFAVVAAIYLTGAQLDIKKVTAAVKTGNLTLS